MCAIAQPARARLTAVLRSSGSHGCAAEYAERAPCSRELRDVLLVAGDSVLVAVKLRRISGLAPVDRCRAGGSHVIARSVADRRFRRGRNRRGRGRRNHHRLRWWRHGNSGRGNDRGDRLHGNRGRCRCRLRRGGWSGTRCVDDSCNRCGCGRCGTGLGLTASASGHEHSAGDHGYRKGRLLHPGHVIRQTGLCVSVSRSTSPTRERAHAVPHADAAVPVVSVRSR